MLGGASAAASPEEGALKAEPVIVLGGASAAAAFEEGALKAEPVLVLGSASAAAAPEEGALKPLLTPISLFTLRPRDEAGGRAQPP